MDAECLLEERSMTFGGYLLKSSFPARLKVAVLFNVEGQVLLCYQVNLMAQLKHATASYREVAKFFIRASLFSPKQVFSHPPVFTSCWKCPFIWNAITMPPSLLNRPTLLFYTSILSPSLHSVSRIVPSSDSDTSQVPSLFCGCFPGNLPFFSPSFPGPLRKFLPCT